MCGCNGSNVAAELVQADATGTDETWYTVAYFNGDTETVQGLDTARVRLMNPTTRIASAQEAGPGGTYARASAPAIEAVA